MGESRKPPLLIGLAIGAGALLLLVGVAAGLLIGRGVPQASPSEGVEPTSSALPATVTSSATATESPGTSSGASEGSFDAENYNTALVSIACSGRGLGRATAEASAGLLRVEVDLTEELGDGQELEILLDVAGDQDFEQLVTYSFDTGSSHLWDGEDEYNFLAVPGELADLTYRVSVPLSELEPKKPAELLVNRIYDPGEGGQEACADETLVVR